MKQCAVCKRRKPESEFNRTRKLYLHGYCKVCQSASDRDRLLRKRYGISLVQYNILLESQGGVCAICDMPPGNRILHVDHDHKCCGGTTGCGKCIRGLLCSRCNIGIGKFRDDPTVLDQAAEYLRNGSVQDWMLLEDE